MANKILECYICGVRKITKGVTKQEFGFTCCKDCIVKQWKINTKVQEVIE